MWALVQLSPHTSQSFVSSVPSVVTTLHGLRHEKHTSPRAARKRSEHSPQRNLWKHGVLSTEATRLWQIAQLLSWPAPALNAACSQRRPFSADVSRSFHDGFCGAAPPPPPDTASGVGGLLLAIARTLAPKRKAVLEDEDMIDAREERARVVMSDDDETPGFLRKRGKNVIEIEEDDPEIEDE